MLSFSLMLGCSSSGNTGENGGQANSAASSSSGVTAEKNGEATHNKKQQGFVTQEDTIEAHLVTRTPQSESGHPSHAHAVKKYYSVQIGAFRISFNADRCLRLIKKRTTYSTVHFYDKAIKMYRVTVGHFIKKEEAFAFRKSLKKNFPKDYRDCWVVEMKR
jgi:cell division septation protein DedD